MDAQVSQNEHTTKKEASESDSAFPSTNDGQALPFQPRERLGPIIACTQTGDIGLLVQDFRLQSMQVQDNSCPTGVDAAEPGVCIVSCRPDRKLAPRAFDDREGLSDVFGTVDSYIGCRWGPTSD